MKQTYDEKHFQVEAMNLSSAWTRTLENLKQNPWGHLLLWGIPTILALLFLMVITGFWSTPQVDLGVFSVSQDFLEALPDWLVSGPGLLAVILMGILASSLVYVVQVSLISQDKPWSGRVLAQGFSGTLGRYWLTQGAFVLGLLAFTILVILVVVVLSFLASAVGINWETLAGGLAGKVLRLLGNIALWALVIAPLHWVSLLPLLFPIKGFAAIRQGLEVFSKNKVLSWILASPFLISAVVQLFAPASEVPSVTQDFTFTLNVSPVVVLSLVPLWYLLLVFEVQAIQGSVRPREETPAVAGTSEAVSAESPELEAH